MPVKGLDWRGGIAKMAVRLKRVRQLATALTIPPKYGALAQLGERNTGSVEVSGSIPLGSTKFLFLK